MAVPIVSGAAPVLKTLAVTSEVAGGVTGVLVATLAAVATAVLVVVWWRTALR
jgi:hypothetical protein